MLRLVILFAALCMGVTHAQDRELAADGDLVKLTIAENYQCGQLAQVKIATKSADYFDQDALTIQRLSNVARAVLGFECQKVTKIQYTGLTDNVVVFRADAKKSSNWAIETYPAPLEGLALLFGLLEPEFLHLGTISAELKKFRDVTGIKESYQYKAYVKQAKRLTGIIDGDTDKFQDYLKNPGKDLGSYENAKTHYTNILETIQTFMPDYYPEYKKTYEGTLSSLRQAYWGSRVGILSKGEKTIAEILISANSLIKTSSQEFSAYVDEHVAGLIEEKAVGYRANIAEAPLYEVSQVTDFVTGFPDPNKAKKLPQTKSILQTLPDELAGLIAQRVSALEDLAVRTIQQSGKSYRDVDLVLETGFTLAQLFEEFGYVEEGQGLLGTTVSHINNILNDGIQEYRNELKTINFTPGNAAALQEQALVFESLSPEFAAYKLYVAAVNDALKANKEKICQGVLKEALVKKYEFNKLIHVGDKSFKLTSLTCVLYENGHVVKGFSSTDNPGHYDLMINEAKGEQAHFILKAKDGKKGKNLIIHSKITDVKTPMSQAEWQEYIALLLLPPPTGKADANGVRECDRLAADPHDSEKLASGVDFEKDDIEPDVFDRAIDSCIAAVEDNPEDPRQLFQLGRLLWYAGDQQAATDYMNAASQAGYAPATYYKAEILLGTSEDQNAFIDALEMFEASGKAGYARGNAMVKELNPDGIDFYKEIPPPTEKQLYKALKFKGKKTPSMLGISISVFVKNVKIKSCFQLSATDFSCEYIRTMGCSVSGSYAHSRLLGAMCDSSGGEVSFGSFRKLSQGNWKEIKSN